MSATLGMLGLHPLDLWTIATGVCCSVACGVIGCFLILRRLSLLGDAISHAVLPGLAAAFILTGSREPLPMLAGALVVGVLTAVLSAGLHRWGRVPEDAAMGVVFSTLFAIGVVMITVVARDVDLDPGCVLWGMIETAGLDLVPFAGIEVPRPLLTLAPILLLNIAVIVVFFKELRIVSFDPYLATTMGISAGLVHYGLMTLVAATSVASFEAVGSVLVVAMLVAPGAAAHLLTDRLSRMIWIAAVLAAVAAIAGYLLALPLRTSVAGMISVVAGAEFLGAVAMAPRYGVLARLAHRLVLAVRIDREDTLGMLYRWHERRGPRPLTPADVVAGVGGGLLTRLALRALYQGGQVVRGPGGALSLTPAGMDAARTVVRSHRLWETYLSQHLGLPPDHVHEPSHRAEHYISAGMREELDREVGRPLDPHGRTIPAERNTGEASTGGP